MLKIITLLLVLAGCSSKKDLTGTYTYTGADPRQQETEIVRQLKDEMKDLMKQDGLYSAIIFKGGKTVMIKSLDMEFAATYERDGDHIIIKATDGELVFKIEDENTLKGEGFAAGIYKKKGAIRLSYQQV